MWRVALSRLEQASLKRLGAAVRRERNAREMTQERLAEMTGLHLRSLQKIEAGDINVLITTVQRIQKALGCPWPSLME